MAGSPSTAKTVAELRGLSDDELVSQYDELAQHTQVGLGYYRDELARREAFLQGQRMERLTVVIGLLTLVNAVAVVIDLGCR